VVPDPEETLAESLERYEPSHVSLVAAQLCRLMDELPEGREDLPLRAILLGGGPLPLRLLEEARKQDWPVVPTYGLTEMTSQVATSDINGSAPTRDAVGKLLPYRELSLAEDGEILVRGNTCCLGYWTPDGLVEPFDEAGWFATGDLGRLDEDGTLHVHGRKDNMFVSGGENIQPEEIEQVLRNLPDVDDAVVVPVPHNEYGHRPVAFVKARRNGFSGEAARHALEDVLPRFKIPDAWHPWPEGVDEAMKIDRQAFCDLACGAGILPACPDHQERLAGGPARQ
jgi:O-succinylbenzoic acid--CoA ligase